MCLAGFCVDAIGRYLDYMLYNQASAAPTRWQLADVSCALRAQMRSLEARAPSDAAIIGWGRGRLEL